MNDFNKNLDEVLSGYNKWAENKWANCVDGDLMHQYTLIKVVKDLVQDLNYMFNTVHFLLNYLHEIELKSDLAKKLGDL